MLCREAAAGRSSQLNRFEFASADHATTHIKDHLAQGGTHRNFDQTGVFDVSGEGKDLGAFTGFGAHGGKPFGTFHKDRGQVGKGLHVIHHSGFAPQAAHGGIRWLGCVLTADECACSGADFSFETEIRAEDVFTHQANFTGLLDGLLDPLDSQGIFGADVSARWLA